MHKRNEVLAHLRKRRPFFCSALGSIALLLLGCDGSLRESQSVPAPRLTLIEVLEEIASDNSRTLSEPDREILLQASGSGTLFNGVVKAIHSRGSAFEFRHYAGGSFGMNSLILCYPNTVPYTHLPLMTKPDTLS